MKLKSELSKFYLTHQVDSKSQRFRQWSKRLLKGRNIKEINNKAIFLIKVGIIENILHQYL
jgi:hypothetical protein